MLLSTVIPGLGAVAAAHVRVNPSAYVPTDGSTDYYRAESAKVTLASECIE